MAEELPIFESMFKKSKGLDLAEEAPSEEESMKKSERYAPDREVLERLATLSPEMQRKVLDQIDGLNPSTPWDIKPKFSMGGDDGWESEEKEVVVPEKHMPGDGGWTNSSWEPIGKSFREMVARDCFEKTGRIPDVEFMDTYEVKKAANGADLDERIKEAVKQTVTTSDGRNSFEKLDEWLEGADDELD